MIATGTADEVPPYISTPFYDGQQARARCESLLKKLSFFNLSSVFDYIRARLSRTMTPSSRQAPDIMMKR